MVIREVVSVATAVDLPVEKRDDVPVAHGVLAGGPVVMDILLAHDLVAFWDFRSLTEVLLADLVMICVGADWLDRLDQADQLVRAVIVGHKESPSSTVALNLVVNREVVSVAMAVYLAVKKGNDVPGSHGVSASVPVETHVCQAHSFIPLWDVGGFEELLLADLFRFVIVWAKRRAWLPVVKPANFTSAVVLNQDMVFVE